MKTVLHKLAANGHEIAIERLAVAVRVGVRREEDCCEEVFYERLPLGSTLGACRRVATLALVAVYGSRPVSVVPGVTEHGGPRPNCFPAVHQRLSREMYEMCND